MKTRLAIVLLAFSIEGRAATATSESVIPMIGRLTGATGREYTTALWLTNAADEKAIVTLTFLKSGQPNPSPRSVELTLPAGQSRLIDPVDRDLLGSDATFGALLLKSSRPVIAQATVASRVAGDDASSAISMSFTATPLSAAFGTGGGTTLHGVRLAGGFRYKFYGVEVAGHPLYCLVELTDLAGKAHAQTSLYLGVHEQRVLDVQELFPAAPPTPSLLRIRGVNGDGRVVFAGSSIATRSEDAAVFEMSTERAPRWNLTGGELVAYSALAIALAAAAVLHRK